ncbi:MAG: prenyltransferase [Elainellaceae cyanobacterium]
MTFQQQSHQSSASILQLIYQLFLNGLIYSNIWVAASIASLVFFVQDTLGIAIEWHPALLIFTAALIPYNLDRIADAYVQKIPDPDAQAYFRNGWGWGMTAIAVLGTAILLYDAPHPVPLVSCGGLVPLIYGIPLFPMRREQGLRWYRLKDIPGSKAWIVCGTITYALIAVPLAYAQMPLSLSAGLTALFLLIFVGTNSHLFDVRDLESDRKKGVLTLPLLVGVTRNRIIWSVLNLLLLPILGWGWRHDLAIPTPLVAIAMIVMNSIFVWTITPKTPRSVYSIGIDGALFAPSLLVWISNAIS